MTELLSETALSALDQIRLTEAEITRKFVEARESSERSLVDARVQANRLKKKARESGIREGKIMYKEIVARAEEEARAITVRARNQAADLRQQGNSRMEIAVEYAISIVLGLEREEISDEP